MSRSVRWGSPTDGSVYEHQRSDSGVGSFSDCESRTSNTDRNFLASGYEDNNAIYTLQRTLEQTRQQRDEFQKKVTELETTVRQLRNEIEQSKAHVRAVTDQNELFTHEKKTLAEKNKELSEQNTQLQEELDNTIKELKKSNRKSSTATGSPTAASSITSDSAEDKKPRRSQSKRRPEKEKERDAEREKEKREKERKREKREKEQHREHDRAEKDDDGIERLRQRFDKHRPDNDSDTKTSSIASSKTVRASRPQSNYIEPLGPGASRPQQTVPPSPARHHSYTGYPPSTGYASIREPSAYAQGAQRSAHPQVYINSAEYAYDEDDPYHPHQVRTGRTERR